MGNDNIYEFGARISRWNYVDYQVIPIYFCIELRSTNPLSIITMTRTSRMFEDHCAIGKIEKLTNNFKDDILGRPAEIFRLQLYDTPMAKYAGYLLQHILFTIYDKLEDAPTFITAYGNAYCDKPVLVLSIDGDCIPYELLEDYYEIVYTKEYNKRFKFE